MPSGHAALVTTVLLGWLRASSSLVAEVWVKVEPVQPGEAGCHISALHLTMQDGSRRETELVPPLVIGSAGAELLIPSGAVRVAFGTEGCWIDSSTLPAAGSARARAWPLARMIGRMPEGTEAANVRAVFLDSGSSDEDSVQSSDCSIEGGNLTCTIPAGRRIHMRLEWAEFAPIVITNQVALRGSEVDLGSITFAPAHAVAGAVTGADGSPIAGANVRLMPIGAAAMAASDRIIQTYHAVSDQRGRYRIINVPAGLYRLVSRVSGLSESIVPSLEVAGDVTAPRLIHRDLATIGVLIDPPMAGNGTLWRVSVTRAGPRQGEIVEIEEGVANPAGVWTSALLPAGEYTVRVSNQAGAEVNVDEVALEGRPERLMVKVKGIAVHGRLVRNEQGISGDLEFTELSGRPTVRTSAGEDGSFSVTFPSPGSWRVRGSVGSSRTSLRLEPVVIREDTTEIEIRLPGGRVSGRVLGSDGKSADAFVAARRNARIVAETRTDEEGAFILENLAEGAYSVEANSESGFAAPRDIQITEDTVDVDLVLTPVQDVTGLVLRSDGRALSGAMVRVFEHSTQSFQDAIADPEGFFSVRVRSVGAIDVIVIAPPFAITVRSFGPADWQGKNVRVVVREERAILRIATTRVPPWPALISADGVARSLGLFLRPQFGIGPLPEFVNGAFEFIVEPGSYRVCNEADCRMITLPTGAEVLVSFVATEGESHEVPR